MVNRIKCCRKVEQGECSDVTRVERSVKCPTALEQSPFQSNRTRHRQTGDLAAACCPAGTSSVDWRLIDGPSWLKALAVKLSRPSGLSGSYTGLIGFNPRRLKGPKRGMSSHATDFSVYAKSSSSCLRPSGLRYSSSAY